MPDGVPDIGALLSNIFTTATDFAGDFFPFLVLTAVIAFLAFYLGRNRLMPFIAGLYAAIPLYQNFPYDLSEFGGAPVSLALYVVLALAAMLAFSGLMNFLADGTMGPLKLLVLSGLTAGMLLAVGIHVLPLKEVYVLGPAVQAWFQSDTAFFWWLVAPIAGLFFLGK